MPRSLISTRRDVSFRGRSPACTPQPLRRRSRVDYPPAALENGRRARARRGRIPPHASPSRLHDRRRRASSIPSAASKRRGCPRRRRHRVRGAAHVGDLEQARVLGLGVVVHAARAAARLLRHRRDDVHLGRRLRGRRLRQRERARLGPGRDRECCASSSFFSMSVMCAVVSSSISSRSSVVSSSGPAIVDRARGRVVDHLLEQHRDDDVDEDDLRSRG